MAKKRKADASSRLDEADRNLYANFRGAANALSQLYSQTVTQQRVSFRSGERHSLEKLYQWILRQREEGMGVTTEDILAYLQDEIEYGTEDTIPVLPSPLSNQHLQAAFPSAQFDVPGLNNVSAPPSNFDDQQAKNSIFSNALSSPVRQSLQQYHLTENSSQHNHGQSSPPSNEPQNPNQRHCHSSPEDSTDMHTDLDPGHKTY